MCIRDRDKTVTEVMYKEAGLTEKDIKDAEKGLDGLLNAIPKYLKAEQEKQRVSYSFDKTDHLKNGDKIIFTAVSYTHLDVYKRQI